METVRQTLDAINNMSPTAVICMIGIRISPKTRLSLIGIEEGVIGPKEDFLKPVFYLSYAIENEILPCGTAKETAPLRDQGASLGTYEDWRKV